MERTRYHEIKSTAGAMLRTALFAGERVLTRVLEGRSQPTPKAIVDLGKSAFEARQVQLVIEGMQPYHPSPIIVPDTRNGFDAEGNFHQQVPDIAGRDIVVERTELGQLRGTA